MFKRTFSIVLIVISLITLAACSTKKFINISANYDSETGKLYVKNLSEKNPYDGVVLTVEYYNEDNSKKIVTYEVESLEPGEEKTIETEEYLGIMRKKAYVKEITYIDIKENRTILIVILSAAVVMGAIIYGFLSYERKNRI